MLLLAEPMTASAIAVDRPLGPLLLAPVIAGVDTADNEQNQSVLPLSFAPRQGRVKLLLL
jgi:hypothetical protein